MYIIYKNTVKYKTVLYIMYCILNIAYCVLCIVYCVYCIWCIIYCISYIGYFIVLYCIVFYCIVLLYCIVLYCIELYVCTFYCITIHLRVCIYVGNSVLYYTRQYKKRLPNIGNVLFCTVLYVCRNVYIILLYSNVLYWYNLYYVCMYIISIMYCILYCLVLMQLVLYVHMDVLLSCTGKIQYNIILAVLYYMVCA